MRKISVLITALFFIFSLGQSFAQSVASNQITNIKLSNQNDRIEIKFELKKLPQYRIFTVSNPPRLVIDFENGSLNTDKSAFGQNKIFKAIRTNLNNQGQLRLVLDLNWQAEIAKSIITKPTAKNKNYYLSIILDDKNSRPKSAPISSPIKDDKITKSLDAKTGTVKYVVKKPSVKPVIIIDAGHGGKDPGTIGKYSRSKEKYITLSYAKELKKQLDKTKKFRVFLTRNSDYFIPLKERVEKARKLKADLFISLHADSNPDKSTSGLSIYTLSENSSDKQAELLAQKENKSDIIGDVDFSATSEDILKTLINMSQRSTMNDSAKFAEISIGSLKNGGVNILQNSHRFAGFRVLTAPDVPSVLIELGYLSNKYEEKTLISAKHKQNVAKALVAAINQYFSTINK